MIIYAVVIIIELTGIATENSTQTFDISAALVFLNMTRGKTYHTDEEINRLILTPKIARGDSARLGDVPYQVAIKSPLPDDKKVYYAFCGGSIITPRTVVSAAHCFIPKHESVLASCLGRINKDLTKSSFAVAGQLENFSKFSGGDSATQGQWRRIADVHFMETYKFPKDDISVLSVRVPFNFNQFVKPISIAHVPTEYGGLQCLASGFGKTSRHQRSAQLRKAVIEILPMRTCDKLFNFDTEKMVCTTDRIADVLEGDSGGPLVCTNTGDTVNKDQAILVGVVSGGIPGKGSLFSRVTAYRKFIERGATCKTKVNNAALVSTIVTLQILLRK